MCRWLRPPHRAFPPGASLVREPAAVAMEKNSSSWESAGAQSLAFLGNAAVSGERELHFHLREIGIQCTGYDQCLGLVVVAAASAILWKIMFKSSLTNKPHKPKSRRLLSGALPPVFPNGWIPVLESSELVLGKIKSVSALGHEFVAVRCEDGTAQVFDAYCPHLGAHLGMMGRVAGDILECPFHGWKFDCKNGSCTHVPYSAKAPSFVKVKVWTSKELLGLVFVWYHADGKAPSWDIPEDILSRTLESKSTGRFEHSVHCHIQDIAENGADPGHFNKIHKASSLVNGTEFEKDMGESWKGRLFQHQWVATWSPNKHEATVTIEAFISILGWKPDYLRHHVEARQIGPALVAISVWGPTGHYVAVQSLRPEGPFDIKVVHRLYFEPGVSWLLRRFYTMTLRNMVDRDAAVWNHKLYLNRPALVKEDQSIAAFRKWYSQFYSSSSPTWQEIREHTLDW
ncbi:cholesterol 7-desaturase nvd-like [Dermacentor andersoni]|uniref:cholesterol 7-desaturase nvd-like n=1 Tax=Dermacentor andersoni TaxID=34620 RepID=UPI003B3A559F